MSLDPNKKLTLPPKRPSAQRPDVVPPFLLGGEEEEVEEVDSNRVWRMRQERARAERRAEGYALVG